MRTVLFFISLDRLAFNEHLEGIYRYARKFAWHVQVLDLPTSPSQMKAILALWKPAGAFVEYGDRKTGFTDRAFGGLPVVFLDIGRRKPGRGLYVGLDSAAVGRMGADSLLRLGLSSYGYVSQRLPEQWDLERGDGFADAIRQSGCKVSVFRPATVLSPEKRHRLLLDWLMALPRPCGLMGVSRRAAENHFRAATGRSIHEEIDEARFALVFDNLRNPKRSLGSIAGICGFPSESALRKAFRQRTGLSMRKWREQRLGA